MVCVCVCVCVISSLAIRAKRLRWDELIYAYTHTHTHKHHIYTHTFTRTNIQRVIIQDKHTNRQDEPSKKDAPPPLRQICSFECLIPSSVSPLLHLLLPRISITVKSRLGLDKEKGDIYLPLVRRGRGKGEKAHPSPFHPSLLPTLRFPTQLAGCSFLPPPRPMLLSTSVCFP